MKNKGLTLTIIANITSNYRDNIDNIRTIQKTHREGKTYAIRSKESLKTALMQGAGFLNELETEKCGKLTQKRVDAENNAANNRALEAGYLNTAKGTVSRRSSFYLTDAVSFEPYINEIRFHNNLSLAEVQAEREGKSPHESGFMPFQYEFDNSLKKYSITIDLDAVGVDRNYSAECNTEEKIERVFKLLDAIRDLSLLVNRSLDNAEPLFVVGGIGRYKTHFFDSVVKLEGARIVLSDTLFKKLADGYSAGFNRTEIFSNEGEVIEKLSPLPVQEFFGKLKSEVRRYYESSEA